MSTHLKSCAVALHRGRNTATFTKNTATPTATNAQPTGLKSLASKVLGRNQERNSTATCTKKERNFSPEKGATFQRNRNFCQGCKRLEWLDLPDGKIAGCLYRATGQYKDGWRRIPDNLERCLNVTGN